MTASRRTPLLVLLLIVGLLVGATAAAGHPFDASDTDHDGYRQWEDNCAENYNPKQQDTDKDTVVTKVGDQNVIVPPGNPGSPPPNTGGDACDTDDDGDGRDDPLDNCKLIPNPDQKDSDVDGKGDVCDFDDDGDGRDDEIDNCPFAPNPNQADHDRDGVGDRCDPDAPKGTASGLLPGFDPKDKTKPKLSVYLPSRFALEAVQAGVPVRVVCSEGCVIQARLRAGRRVLGKGNALIEAKGSTYVFLRFTKGSLARLKRAGRARPTLELAVADASNNKMTVRRRITLVG